MNKEEIFKILESKVFNSDMSLYPGAEAVLSEFKELILLNIDKTELSPLDLVYASIEHILGEIVRVLSGGKTPKDQGCLEDFSDLPS